MRKLIMYSIIMRDIFRRNDDGTISDNRLSVLFGMLSLAVSVGFVVARLCFDLLHRLNDDKFIPNVNDYIIALLSGVNVSLLFYAIRGWARLSDIYTTIGGVKGSITHIEQATLNQAKQYAVFRTVDGYNDVARTVTRNFLNHHYSISTADSGRVGVNTLNLSIEFINSMWEELIKRQYEKEENEENIVVDVVHTNNLRFWSRDDAEESLERQYRFIAAGGTVNRIIRGEAYVKSISNTISGQSAVLGKYYEESQESKDEVPSQYVADCEEVIRKMIDRGINVSYIYSKEAPEKDFCIVHLTKFDKLLDDMSMIWYMNGEIITYCDLLIENKENPGVLEDTKSKMGALKLRVRDRGMRWEGLNVKFAAKCAKDASSGGDLTQMPDKGQ